MGTEALWRSGQARLRPKEQVIGSNPIRVSSRRSSVAERVPGTDETRVRFAAPAPRE